ncbi:ComEC/Rec2 family competence protein [Roseococcus sp. DSY-14]|uniref:ComEC/Rec2 family competence protein n=1 Tax=Roseococcus sp. DSY-14 TaxID=3369650 RepID=UPI00387B5143
MPLRRAFHAAEAALAGEHGRLAPWLAVAMGAGVLAFLLPRSDPPGWLAWAALGPLPPALLLARRTLLGGWLLGLVAAAGLGFAAAAWHVAAAPAMPDFPRTALVVTGTVSELDPLPNGARITLRGARWTEAMAPLERDIRVRLQARDALRPQPGEAVRLRALLRPPSAPAYPGGWDFQRAAFFDGLGGSGFALGPVEVLAPVGAAPQGHGGATPQGHGGAVPQGHAGAAPPAQGRAPPLAPLRAAMEARVMAALPGDAGAISAALLSGGQSGISPAGMQAMRDSGLAHLLSVSGLHIAIVIGAAAFVARLVLALVPAFALRWGTRPWALLAGVAAGGFYTVLTGLQVPMLRAFAMACLVALAVLAGRRALSPRVLAVAAALVLLWNPAAVLGPSFQMSFAAVLALVAAAEAARGRVPPPGWRRALFWVGASIATSVVAGLATMPFGLHHFGRVQLYGVAANALAVPLTSFLVMPAGMLAALLMPLGLEAWPLALMGWGVEGVLLIARAVAAWPGAAMALAPIPGWGLALAGFGLCWLCLWRRRWRWAGVPLVAAGLLSALLARPPDAVAAADGRLFLLRDGEALFLERRAGASRFVRDAWLRQFGEAEAPELPRETTQGALDCTPARCILAGRLALLRPAPPPRGVRRPADWTPEPLCGQVQVLLSPEPVRGRCEGTQVVDRFAVWRDGAHAVWLEPGGARVLSDRAHRGERPWVPPRPRPRAQAEEPPAEVE